MLVSTIVARSQKDDNSDPRAQHTFYGQNNIHAAQRGFPVGLPAYHVANHHKNRERFTPAEGLAGVKRSLLRTHSTVYEAADQQILNISPVGYWSFFTGQRQRVESPGNFVQA